MIEAQLLGQIERFEDISSLASQASVVSAEELGELLKELRTTGERVEALEARNSATARVIERAAGATLFLQGSYRFIQPASGRPLRMIPGPDGQPLRNAMGHPALTVDGDGPPFEVFLTGTGFIASPDGLALTNRHVVLPWESDAAARGIFESGFVAEWSRLVGFLADGSEAHDVRLRVASDEADLAVVQVLGVEGPVPFLELASTAPSLGDPVIVMGYPLGLKALIARSDAAFVEGLRQQGTVDFFEQARRIATAGFMKPLATRGIVGQVTNATSCTMRKPHSVEAVASVVIGR